MKALAIVLTILLSFTLSWGVTVGIIYLICMCFTLEFSLLIATGIWLVIMLLRGVFGGSK